MPTLPLLHGASRPRYSMIRAVSSIWFGAVCSRQPPDSPVPRTCALGDGVAALREPFDRVDQVAARGSARRPAMTYGVMIRTVGIRCGGVLPSFAAGSQVSTYRSIPSWASRSAAGAPVPRRRLRPVERLRQRPRLERRPDVRRRRPRRPWRHRRVRKAGAERGGTETHVTRNAQRSEKWRRAGGEHPRPPAARAARPASEGCVRNCAERKLRSALAVAAIELRSAREARRLRGPLIRLGATSPRPGMMGMIRMATMFATLIIGLIAGPAVSL